MKKSHQQKVKNQTKKTTTNKPTKRSTTTKRTISTKRKIATKRRQTTSTAPPALFQTTAAFSTTLTNLAPTTIQKGLVKKTSISFTSTFHPKSTTAPTISLSRLFGSHAVEQPLGLNRPYESQQIEKYGKLKLNEYYKVDTPSFKKSFAPISMEGTDLASRPDNQNISPEDMIAKFGVVLVDKEVAICNGTEDGAHPIEFIQVNTSFPKVPQICKYCGTRFMMKSAWDGSVVKFEQEM